MFETVHIDFRVISSLASAMELDEAVIKRGINLEVGEIRRFGDDEDGGTRDAAAHGTTSSFSLTGLAEPLILA